MASPDLRYYYDDLMNNTQIYQSLRLSAQQAFRQLAIYLSLRLIPAFTWRVLVPAFYTIPVSKYGVFVAILSKPNPDKSMEELRPDAKISAAARPAAGLICSPCPEKPLQ